MDIESAYEESEEFLSGSSDSDAQSSASEHTNAENESEKDEQKPASNTVYKTIFMPAGARHRTIEDDILPDKPRMKMILDRYINVNRVPAREYYQSRRRDNIPRPAESFRAKRK